MPVQIALASDERYFCGLLVTACSIAKCAEKTVALRFYVLDGGIKDEKFILLNNKILAYHPMSEIVRMPVNENDFADCPSWNGSRLIYVRLMLPKLLSDVDWVIYCDVDFLWMRDVSKLWNERDDKYAFVGVLDPAGWVRIAEEKWCANQGLCSPADEYCCAGLSFMNLKMFRDEHLFEQCMEVNRLHPPYNDQTIFNVVAHGRKKIVSEVWQCFHWRLTLDYLRQGVVVHHAGNIPWKPLCRKINLLSDATMLWHQLNAEIYGISVWRSLRFWMSPAHIIWHRGLYWLMQVPGAKTFAKTLFSAIGHPGVWRGLDANARRLK